MGRKFFMVILVLFGCMILSQPVLFAEGPPQVDLGEPTITVNDMVVVDGTAYVANGDGLVIFDVANPTERQTITIDGGVRKVIIAGDYAYLVKSNDELVVINLDQEGTQEEPEETEEVSDRPHFDSQHMELTIPEVDVGGELYMVIMKQRGSSNNFEVTFAAPVTTDETQGE